MSKKVGYVTLLNLLHVGHSSLDGGLPLGHVELWQRMVEDIVFQRIGTM